MNARIRSALLAAALALAPAGARSAPPQPSPSPSPQAAATAAPQASPAASPQASPAASPQPAATAPALAELLVRGRFLACERGFLALTNGATLRLADAALPCAGKLGETIRVHLDPATHLVREIEREPKGVLAGEIEIGALPAGYATATAETPPPRAPGSAAEGASVTVTIVARIPDDTPLSDDVYISTDRSSFNPAELRLVRLDSRHWTINLSLPRGSTLHYRFTRGSFETGERDRAGALVPPRALVASPGLQEADTIERWADRN